MKAVIPAAGLGTRLLPLTKSIPKEMLPLLDRPIIQWVVEEAVACGADDILIVTGRHKRAIEDHFDAAPELERFLEAAGKREELARVRAVSDLADLHYVRQKEPRGLGDAVAQARRHIGDEPFLLMLGDDVVLGQRPSEALVSTTASVVGVERVEGPAISRYGVAKIGAAVAEGRWKALGFVEKPRPAEAPSDLAIMGRYWLQPAIFDHLANVGLGRGGEVQLTDALDAMAAQDDVLVGIVPGERLDLGTLDSWLEGNIRARSIGRH